ncbi:MAG: cytochrome c [Chloroflexi bacterium]|nr:cytochrome c [Chloroflexota bacterium]
MFSRLSRGISIVPVAITIGLIAAMVVLVGQITLKPWASADAGFDTHLNYSTVSDGYARTKVARVEADQPPFDGWVPTSDGDTEIPLAAWAGYACASCHGIDGTGGLVGPNLQELTREDFTEKIRFGQDGMPAFGELDLTDEHIAVLSAYLIEVGGPPPTATPVPPTPTPTPTAIPTPTATGPAPTSVPTPEATAISGGDAELIAAGKLLYEETAGVKRCADCHGLSAEGGGPGSSSAPGIGGATRTQIRRSIDDAFEMNDIKLTSEDLLALEAYLGLFKSDE